MKQILLAKRYAKALFELALQEKATEKVFHDMETVATVISENRELRRVMANPLITPARKSGLMNALFGSLISPLSLRFFDILVRKGREQQIEEIAKQYAALYLDHNNIAVAELTTAFAANESIKNTITGLVRHNTDKTLQFSLTTDPEIIGGFRLKIGDYLFDASISKIISNLHKEFDKNLYIKRF
ncbi:MAG TPA: ATP synthase F1 subunit delta [Bacteroidales bacterium]|nr:ATP synthase F1 subunit delta [Bacteroidales bacterium]HQQ12548.1 ATP synthase F1 subunit delta [Bacteroidales bacterium]